MLSVEFNIWAENYIEKFKKSNKFDKVKMINDLTVDILYLKSDLDSYQLVLNQLKDMEEKI